MSSPRRVQTESIRRLREAHLSMGVPGCVEVWAGVESRVDGVGRVRLIRTGDRKMAEPVNINAGAGTEPKPDPNEKLVKVFDSEQESEAMVVKGLLDSAGIDSDLTSASLLQDAFPGLGGMIILVREEDAEEARRLIAEQRRPTPDDDETAEIAIIQDEEPPRKA